MALEDKFKEELRGIGILTSTLIGIDRATQDSEKWTLYERAADVIAKRDPNTRKVVLKELRVNPAIAYGKIDDAISTRIDLPYEEGKEKTVEEEYKDNLDTLVGTVADKLDEELRDEKIDAKHKAVSVLAKYFRAIMKTPRDEAQAQALLAAHLRMGFVTESTSSDIEPIAIRLAIADYIEGSDKKYTVNKKKLKELMGENIRAGAYLYTATTQKKE